MFQTTIAKPSRAALKRAFRALGELVDIDAATMSNDGYGVLTEGLSRENAGKLSAALNAEGVPTRVVDESTIVRLPQAKIVRRLDCIPSGLISYDPLGRPTSIDWSHVVLVASGFVTGKERQRTEKTRVVYRGTGRGGSHPIELTDVSYSEERKARLILEVYLNVAPGRLRVAAHKCRYDYLGDRLTQRYMDNYALLIQDLCRFASGALLNRGADSLRSDETVTFQYPSRHAFEEEIIWLLWSKLGIRRR